MEPNFTNLADEFKYIIEATKRLSLADAPFKENLEKLYNNYIQKKICIMVIGETSSGKTTLVNCFISYDSIQKKFNPDYLNLLPRDDRENTCYLWVVESSSDQNFYLHIDRDPPKKYTKSQLTDLKSDIKQLNESQKKEIQNMKSNTLQFEQKVILIQIPNFDPDLRLIDVAGLSSQKVKSSLCQHFSNEMACLFYVKDISQPESIKENMINFISDIQAQDKEKDGSFDVPVLFSIILTKKDKFFKMEGDSFDSYANDNYDDEENVKKKYEKKTLDDFKDIINTTKNCLVKKNIQIYNVHLLNLLSLTMLQKPDHEQEKMYFLRLYKSFEHIKTFMNKTKPFKFCNTIFDILQQKINEKMKEKMISEEFLFEIQCQIDEEIYKFIENINTFFFHFQDIKSLSNYESEFYSDLQALVKKEIEEDKKNVSGWDVLSRNNFIEKILKKIQDHILEKIMMKIQKEFMISFKSLMFKIRKIIGNRNYQSIFNIEASNITSSGLNFDQEDSRTFALLLTGTIYTVGIWGTQKAMISAGLLAIGESLIPGIGWIAGIATIATTLYGLKNYIGLFDREKCADDIIKKMVVSIYDRKNEIKKNNIIQAKKAYEKVINRLNSAKVATQEIDEIKTRILMNTTKLKNNMSSNSFKIGDRFLWKKIEIEELSGLKNFKKDFSEFETFLKKEAHNEF